MGMEVHYTTHKGTTRNYNKYMNACVVVVVGTQAPTTQTIMRLPHLARHMTISNNKMGTWVPTPQRCSLVGGLGGPTSRVPTTAAGIRTNSSIDFSTLFFNCLH